MYFSSVAPRRDHPAYYPTNATRRVADQYYFGESLVLGNSSLRGHWLSLRISPPPLDWSRRTILALRVGYSIVVPGYPPPTHPHGSRFVELPLLAHPHPQRSYEMLSLVLIGYISGNSNLHNRSAIWGNYGSSRQSKTKQESVKSTN